MADKILTISIAAYNVSKTLDEALIPFTKCKNKEKLEVLVVNDGSTDDTVNIAKKFVEKYPDVFQIIDKENGGWGSTLNAGMKYGSGKYFKQLDGDDYFSEENLDDFLNFLETTDADMVYSPFVTFSDKNGAILRVLGDYGNTVPKKELMGIDEIPGFSPAMHTLCIKMSVLKNNDIQITEHCFYTDVEFVLKCCNFCKTLTMYDFPIYYYRLARNGQSMSIGGVRKHYKDHLKMLLTMLCYEKEHVTRTEIKKIFRTRLSGACEFQYIFFFALERTDQQKQELIDFDHELQKEYPEYYDAIRNNAVRLLRKTGFKGYKYIGQVQTERDKKRKINIFEGC